MSGSFFNLEIYTPARVVVKKMEADEITVPTVSGEVTILPQHTHIIEKLDTGIMTVVTGSEKKHFLVTTGICKVLNKQITILADVAESSDEIDPKRAQTALDNSLRVLSGEKILQGLELAKYQRKAHRAEVRLKIASGNKLN